MGTTQRLWHATVVLMGFSVSTPAWACSGPGADDAMQTSGTIALATWVANVLITVAVFVLPRLRPTKWRWRFFWVGLPVLQSMFIFTLGTARGDCGFMLRDFSLGLGGFTLVALILNVLVSRGLWPGLRKV